MIVRRCSKHVYFLTPFIGVSHNPSSPCIFSHMILYGSHNSIYNDPWGPHLGTNERKTPQRGTTGYAGLVPEEVGEGAAERAASTRCLLGVVIPRPYQQTPGAYPKPPFQQFLFGNSFHLGVKGDVWGMLQGYVGFPLE